MMETSGCPPEGGWVPATNLWTRWTLPIYSHASLHQQRVNPGAASSQLKVDRAVSQNHPLAPKASSLKQSDGRQRELLRSEEEKKRGGGGGEGEKGWRWGYLKGTLVLIVQCLVDSRFYLGLFDIIEDWFKASATLVTFIHQCQDSEEVIAVCPSSSHSAHKMINDKS